MTEESSSSTGMSNNNLKSVHFEGVKSLHKVDEWRCRIHVRRKFIDFPFKPNVASTLPDFVYVPKMDHFGVEREKHTTEKATIEALNQIGIVAKGESYRSLEAKVFDYFGFEDMIPSYAFTLRDDLGFLLKTIDEERIVNKYAQVVGEVDNADYRKVAKENGLKSELQAVHNAAYMSSVQNVPTSEGGGRKKQKVSAAPRVSKASKASKARSMPETHSVRKLLPVPMAHKEPIKQMVNRDQMEEMSLREARLIEMEQREEMRLIQRIQEIERRQKMAKNLHVPHIQQMQKTQKEPSWQKKEE